MSKIKPLGYKFVVLNWILEKSAMTFTYDLEIWLNAAAHPLLKSSVYLKHESDRAKGGSKYALNFFWHGLI